MGVTAWKKSGKFVVIIFPKGLQGRIWSTILQSQTLSVIWESPDVPLLHSLEVSQQQGSLPDLLIIDTRLHNLQPFHLCRWCQQNGSGIKILLVNGGQPRILATERQWAMNQGAADLLPRICQKALVSGAAANLRRALDLMDILPCNQQTLVTSLLRLKIVSPPPPPPRRYPELHIEAKESTPREV